MVINMDYRNIKGRIFNIQRYSVHDGPGVRTIVFLKGCYLRCRWCCNPESQEYEIQKMTVGGTVKTVGEDKTAGEIIDDIAKDMPYFRRSGGGITLSGGECLAQPDFAEALLVCAKEYGLSTAVESTAFARFEVIEKLLPHLDYYLMDIKHMNSAKHKEFTAQPNELIIENAKKIADYKGTKLTIRVPVIPTFNDTEEEISAIAEFAASLKVEQLHLLPYHRMGEDKYKGLGREYKMVDIYPPTDEKMKSLKRAAEKFDIKVQIGG